MRLSSVRLYSRGIVATACTALVLAPGAFARPAADEAPLSFGPKVDASVLAQLRTARSADSELHVIVFGRRLGGLLAEEDIESRNRLRLVPAYGVTVRARALRALTRDPNVRYVTADVPVRPTTLGVPTPPLSGLATHYPQLVGAPAAWNAGFTGAGVGIAVIDSGTAAHQDFAGRLTQVQLAGQTNMDDRYGHGTLVAGVAAGKSADGRFVGIAPGASVYALNVTAADGGLYTSDVVAGLDWVLANREARNIRVVNLSLAETVPSSYRESLLDTAVERLWRAGVVVVVSSGNTGPDTMRYAPGNDPFVITVGAIDTADTLTTADDVVASFSGSGVTADGHVKPELLAPGRKIASLLSTGSTLALAAPAANLIAPGYATISGTSFAAPQVAGAAAVVLQKNPALTPDQVKGLLIASSRPLGVTRALDLGAAVAGTSSPVSSNQGLEPTFYGLGAASVALDATNGTWNNGTWNNGTWNNGTWNNGTWNVGSWNHAAWD
jgi:serine protease AprX